MKSRVLDSRDRRFMQKAVALARKGVGLASPNPTVGCVVVRRGEIVGEGWHEYALRDHAEVRAMREAGERARGSTAYITLEPCVHEGRTPPCADLLIESGIRRVVVPMLDPNPLVSGKGIERLRAASIRVDVGLMVEKVVRLVEPFACHVATGRPLVVAKVGMSLDGRIAVARGKNGCITSPEAREFGQSLRHQLDAVLVGVGTILADDPQLTYRGLRRKARPLVRVVLDSHLRISPAARVFQSDPASPVVIFCRRDAPAKLRKALERRGAELIAVAHSRHGLDLDEVLVELGKQNLLGILVEGGSEIHWSFLSAGLVDKFYFIVAPLVLGGRHSVPAVGGAGYRIVAEAMWFRNLRVFKIGCDLVMESYPASSRSMLSPWLASKTPPSDGPDP